MCISQTFRAVVALNGSATAVEGTVDVDDDDNDVDDDDDDDERIVY